MRKGKAPQLAVAGRLELLELRDVDGTGLDLQVVGTRERPAVHEVALDEEDGPLVVLLGLLDLEGDHVDGLAHSEVEVVTQLGELDVVSHRVHDAGEAEGAAPGDVHPRLSGGLGHGGHCLALLCNRGELGVSLSADYRSCKPSSFESLVIILKN